MSGNIIKKTRAAFLALIMITSATAAGVAFSGSVGAQEADIIVGPDNGDDYSTIQDAIEKASTDAVIEVKEKSGDYLSRFELIKPPRERLLREQDDCAV